MPTEVMAACFAIFLGLSGAVLKKFSDGEKRMDRIELTLAKEYMTKQDFHVALERVFTAIDRFEAKLDYHVYGERTDGTQV